IAYRFLILMANYGSKMNFNWQALEGAETALKRLYVLYNGLGSDIGNINEDYKNKFKEYLEDDLNTPRALTVLWDLIKDENISNADKKATILNFDKVLGLGFELEEKTVKEEIIPSDVIKLVEEREEARKNKDYKKSDDLRAQINSLGYEVKDSEEGYKISKN
ncbi:MAG: DALR domain-containing protein, partial [bacterium]